MNYVWVAEQEGCLLVWLTPLRAKSCPNPLHSQGAGKAWEPLFGLHSQLAFPISRSYILLLYLFVLCCLSLRSTYIQFCKILLVNTSLPFYHTSKFPLDQNLWCFSVDFKKEYTNRGGNKSVQLALRPAPFVVYCWLGDHSPQLSHSHAQGLI